MTIDRRSPEYIRWRKLVLDKDCHRCVNCGNEIKLEAHHILPASLFPEKAYDVSNGITLCRKCHYEVHNKTYVNDNAIPSLMHNIHPFFMKLRDITYYLSYRKGIVLTFWRSLPLPFKFRRWLEKLIVSIIVLLILITCSFIRGLFHV